MQFAQKRYPNLFRLWPSTAQGTKKMGRLPDIILWVGWDRSLCHDSVKGGHLSSSLHPACIGMCIPRMLSVGKVGIKDGLERPASATGPSQLGSMGPRAGQVKTWTNYQVGQSVLHCGTKSTPTTCPPNKTPTPVTMVKSSLLRPTMKSLLCSIIISHSTTFLQKRGTNFFL